MMTYAWSGDASKRPLVFVHGSPGSWEGWAHFLQDPELQKNFQILAVDRPGYGGSGEGQTEPSLAEQANNIIEVLRANQSGLPAIFVGHSFGGPVVARLAMDHGDKVAGVVFAAASVDPELEHTKWFQIPAGWWPFRVMIPTSLRVCNEEIRPFIGELAAMLPLWSKITAPVVLIQGEDDDLVPPANQDFLIKHLTQSAHVSVVKVPGLNHFIPWKRPDLIISGINELTTRLEQTGRKEMIK